jgi:site-specific DNA-methyltransferase (adenine-specific)
MLVATENFMNKKMQTNIIHLQDCREGMDALPEHSVEICVTSPPYNLNIDYGEYRDDKPRQEYLQWLDQVFQCVKRVLKDDGHFWLNVGYSNIDPWVGMDVAQIARRHFVLQNNFVWVKSIAINDVTSGHFKPINSGRFANATWEHLFHFTKSGKVTCDKLAVGVPYMWDCNLDNVGRTRGRLAKKLGFRDIRDFEARASQEMRQEFQTQLDARMATKKPKPDRRCRGNTWFVPYDTIANRDRHRGSHPATYPVALVEQCIKFSGVTSGTLLDPFMGSGTSAVAALRQDLRYIGYDIDKNYIEFAQDRIADSQAHDIGK